MSEGTQQEWIHEDLVNYVGSYIENCRPYQSPEKRVGRQILRNCQG